MVSSIEVQHVFTTPVDQLRKDYVLSMLARMKVRSLPISRTSARWKTRLGSIPLRAASDAAPLQVDCTA